MIANIFTALLTEVRSPLRAPFWRRLVVLLGARARALATGIEVHLDAAAPPAIAGPPSAWHAFPTSPSTW